MGKCDATVGVLCDSWWGGKTFRILSQSLNVRLELSQTAWLMCVIARTIPNPKPRDTEMLNGTQEITADDCYFVHLATTELLEELREALEQMTIPTEGKKEMVRFFRRMDDLHDALDGLTSRFPVKRNA